MENFDFEFDDTYVLNYVDYSGLDQVSGRYGVQDDLSLPSYDIANMALPVSQQYTSANEAMYAVAGDNLSGNAVMVNSVMNPANWSYSEMSSTQTLSQSSQQRK